jgi:hypothetical protein
MNRLGLLIFGLMAGEACINQDSSSLPCLTME